MAAMKAAIQKSDAEIERMEDKLDRCAISVDDMQDRLDEFEVTINEMRDELYAQRNEYEAENERCQEEDEEDEHACD